MYNKIILNYIITNKIYRETDKVFENIFYCLNNLLISSDELYELSNKDDYLFTKLYRMYSFDFLLPYSLKNDKKYMKKLKGKQEFKY